MKCSTTAIRLKSAPSSPAAKFEQLHPFFSLHIVSNHARRACSPRVERHSALHAHISSGQSLNEPVHHPLDLNSSHVCRRHQHPAFQQKLVATLKTDSTRMVRAIDGIGSTVSHTPQIQVGPERDHSLESADAAAGVSDDCAYLQSAVAIPETDDGEQDLRGRAVSAAPVPDL